VPDCFDALRTKLLSCLWVKSSSIFTSSRSGCANPTLSIFQCLTVK